MKWNCFQRPKAGGEPLLTLEEARYRLQAPGLPCRRTRDFPQPADKLFSSGADKRPRFRLSDLQDWLSRKGISFVPYKIEKGLPMPPAHRKKPENVELVQVLKSLEVGDSVEYEENQRIAIIEASEGGRRFATRAIGTNTGKRRVWRIE